MESEILKYVFTQTIFGGLFVWLLIDTQKKNSERETRGEARETGYQSIIKELTSKLGTVDVISDKIDKVEIKIEEILRK